MTTRKRRLRGRWVAAARRVASQQRRRPPPGTMRGSAGGGSQIRAVVRAGARRRCRRWAGSRGGEDDWTRWLVALGLGIRGRCAIKWRGDWKRGEVRSGSTGQPRGKEGDDRRPSLSREGVMTSLMLFFLWSFQIPMSVFFPIKCYLMCNFHQ